MQYSFVGTIANIYIWQKKNWALLTDLLKVKNNVFARQLLHTKTYIQFKYPPINVYWTFKIEYEIYFEYKFEIDFGIEIEFEIEIEISFEFDFKVAFKVVFPFLSNVLF